LDIRCVPAGGGELSTFLRLPRLIYGGMKGFVPRLDLGEKLSLAPKHAPFFKHGSAQFWVAYRGGKPVGRISAQIDRLQSEPYGMFGCFDAIDDADVVRALLSEAEGWLRQQGQTKMRGPFSLSINGESGLLATGQDKGPMIMMPWNPAYLEGQLIAAGLAPVRNLFCYSIDLRNFGGGDIAAAVRMPKLPPSVNVRTLNLKRLDAESKIIADIYNSAWSENWGFVPIEEHEVRTLAHAFRPFLVPECGSVFEVDGVPMAMALVLPNLEMLTADFGGRLLPFNWAKLIWRAVKKQYRSGRMLLFGVDKRLQGSILGAVAPFAMLNAYARYAQKYKLHELELSWVLEENRPVRSIIERFGARQSKRYVVFEKVL
jgi:hypothetical protein